MGFHILLFIFVSVSKLWRYHNQSFSLLYSLQQEITGLKRKKKLFNQPKCHHRSPFYTLKNQCHLPIVSSYLHCSILYKSWHHICVLPLSLSSPRLLSERLSDNTTVQAQKQLHNQRKKFCKISHSAACQKTLGPDSVIWPLKSHSNLPPPQAPSACHQQRTLFLLPLCLDAAPRKHLEVTGYGVTSNKSEQAQICGTVQSVLCSEKP